MRMSSHAIIFITAIAIFKNLPSNMFRMKLQSETFLLDPLNLPIDNAFNELLSKLSSSDASSAALTEIAFLYRGNYDCAKRLYDMARSKAVTDNEQMNNIDVLLLGLLVHHNKATEADFYDLNYIQDKRIDMLKGFYLYRRKDYDGAYFSFSKISYIFGMELCMHLMDNRDPLVHINDWRIRCYGDSREWKSCGPQYLGIDNINKEFLFRIGHSDTYTDKTNIDVQLTLIEREISNIISEGLDISGQRGTEIEKKLNSVLERLNELKEEYCDSAEILYLIGKTEHLKSNYELAKEAYEQALEKDPKYLPAEFNFCRIEGKALKTESNYPSISDHRALTSIKNGDYNINISNCTDEIRKLYLIMIRSRNGDRSCFTEMKALLEDNHSPFDKEMLCNNLALLTKDKEEAANFLNIAIRDCSSKYEDYLKYNLGVITGDVELLKSSALPEAADHIALLKNDMHSNNAELKGFILMNSDKEKAKKYLKSQIHNAGINNKGYLFAVIALGSIYIDEYISSLNHKTLEDAIKLYKGCPFSFYCVNGLGICYALKGRVDLALKLFNQIIDEYPSAVFNIAACHILEGKYEKAIDMLIANPNRERSDDQLIVSVCEELGDIKMVEYCISSGIFGLEDIHDKLLAKNNGQTEKENLKEETRKRKIQEIEESRKRLNFD